MIEYEIYSVKDVVSGDFTEITIFKNREMAMRWFKSLCAESKIAQDLQLFYLGTYNIATGEIKSAVEFIGGGTNG